jgi:hypothetical protein
LAVDRARTCSLASLGRSVRSGPEGFVGLMGLAAPALLGWGLRVTVYAWSVGRSPLKDRFTLDDLIHSALPSVLQ